MRHVLSLCALVMCSVGYCVPAQGASDAVRELRLELALIAGDARMLADPATPLRCREGLSDRVRSSLGSLKITARYAEQERGRPDPQLATGVGELRALFTAGKILAFSRRAAQFAAQYPIELSYFEPLAVSARRLEMGRSIYTQYCIGCHTSPDPSAEDPAPNLFQMARTVPRHELIARLLAGIHGDQMTGLENPFTDEAIAALAVYLLDGESAGALK